MSVVGDEIICNCRKCFSKKGYGIRLKSNGDGIMVCPHCNQEYVAKNGFLERFGTEAESKAWVF